MSIQQSESSFITAASIVMMSVSSATSASQILYIQLMTLFSSNTGRKPWFGVTCTSVSCVTGL